jgi:hypothetical protein
MNLRLPILLCVAASAVYCFGLSLLAPAACAQESTPKHSDNRASEPFAVLVDTVRIEGGSELTTSEKAALTDSLLGESIKLDWLDRLKAKATRELHDNGFLDGRATVKVDSKQLFGEKEHVTVTLTLSPGARYYIKQIWWTGSSVFSPAQLDNLTLFRVGDVFRVSSLRGSDALLRQAYKEQGYDEMSFAPQFQKFPEKGFVLLYLEVMEGRKSEHQKPLTCKQYSIEEIQSTPYVQNLTYNPKDDAELQIERAKIEAQRVKKKLLLITGGEWCGWCRVLDQTFQRNPTIKDLRDKNFVVVYVDVTAGNNQECALNTYPNPPSFPFLYVLDETGKLLGTEDTRDWESSDGYDPRRIEVFLEKW